ncbi:RloB domain-containing protein [Adlercreutzia sp. ZJ242]|uniref:RloB domain-containing protein n=1 Tax=Adlercreutzia sp. ZJ242 TaxID=2709409 RepID=UPI0013ED6FFF|nr:RloB domain-containing protein [Adlercreutzia sp. ZJ242]
MASMMLICCEGKTECEYFDILRRSVFRLPGYFDIRIEGEKGQHKKLIDHTVARRSKIAQEEGLVEDDVECWVVCDDDNMIISNFQPHRFRSEQHPISGRAA